MEILPGIKIIDLALIVKDTLIISDTHIGYEEALNKQGVLIPRFQFKEIMGRLDNIFKKAGRIKRFIINGDMNHEFGTISQRERRHTLELLDYISGKCREIILVKGNHDTIISLIAEKRGLRIVDSYLMAFRNKKILFLHGDKIPDKMPKSDIIIIGHQHPAITLRDGVRAELYKCFLKGRYKKSDLIVLPAFTLVSEGTDVLKEVLSPFLEQNLEEFYVYPVADDVYEFGKIKEIIKTY